MVAESPFRRGTVARAALNALWRLPPPDYRLDLTIGPANGQAVAFKEGRLFISEEVALAELPDLIRSQWWQVLDYKHLSGKHNQKRHAGSGGAGAMADSLLDKAKETEPRITASLDSIVSAAGGKMEGLEFRLKSKESLELKIKDEFRNHPQWALEDIPKRDVTDITRYTAVFPPHVYRKGVEATRAKLESGGAKIVKARNYWQEGREDYKGVNAVFEDKSKVRFELQFHTPQSFKAKMENHLLYQEARELPNTRAGKTRLSELISTQNKRYQSVGTPAGAESVF